MDVDGAGIGARLRGCRQAAGLSQQELADRSGLSIRAVSNLERGRTQWPYRDSMSRLADALGLQEKARSELLAAVPRRRLERPLVPTDVAIADHRLVIPRQLPTTARYFTGRVKELATLDQLLAASLDVPGVALISAIGGTAGVGKTALALRWAHQAAGQFPDGQLYVNLRGYDRGQPLAPGEALAGFLAALGVPGPQIPTEEADRATAYRSVLAGRRVLIVLDNAHDAEQVRSLLPGEPGCMVVVTSRDMLAGLVARDGARRVLLGPLPLRDAVTLFRALIGPRVDVEPDAAAQLAVACCRLPLALRVAAELAAARPAMSLAALSADLDGGAALDALEAGGDQATAVRGVFSWSCRHLSPAAARAFRLAALHPGPSFDSGAVAALTHCSQPAAAQALTELARASLIQQTGSDRYGMHDLLRAYAAELAAAQDPEADRRAAMTRLLDYYLDTTRCAAAILFPADARKSADTPAIASAAVVGAEHAARAWLDAERPNLTAVAAYAGKDGWPGHAAGLSAALFRYLHTGGFLAQAMVIHRAACQAGDPAAESGAVNSIGAVYMMLGRYRQAGQHFRRAFQLSHAADDRFGEHRALLNLGEMYLRTGAYPAATASCEQALQLSRSAGDLVREARALMYLGQIAIRQGRYRHAAASLRQAVEAGRAGGDAAFLTVSLTHLSYVEVRQGRYQQGKRHLEEARIIARQTGQQIAEADINAMLGFADISEGRHPEAAQHLQQALAAFSDAGASASQAGVLCNLGKLDLELGRPAQAAGHYQRALSTYRRVCDRAGEAEAHNGLGEAALAQGAPDRARAHHQAALAIAGKIINLDCQARAHEGLGNVSAATGDAGLAREHLARALALYTELDTPDTTRIQSRLANRCDSLAWEQPAFQPGRRLQMSCRNPTRPAK
jgi:tetratricopeptide (TPR) repeat protein/transcriptional regulator with XRE-family HTH domain